MRRYQITVAILSLLVLLGPVRSQAAPRPADEFQRHYERGRQRYEAGDYEEAIREYQHAFSIRQFPRLLLHLGQAHRKLGHAKEALGYLQAYLRVEPDPIPGVKPELERYIAAIGPLVEIAEQERSKLNEQERQAPPVSAGQQPPPAGAALTLQAPREARNAESGRHPIHKRWWFWTAVGGVVTTAIVVGVVAGRSGGEACPPGTCFKPF